MRTNTIVFTSCVVALGYVLFQISIETSNVVAQPSSAVVPSQGKNLSASVPNINEPSTGNVSSKPTMLPYVNTLNGISMLYPSDWQPYTSGLSFPELIRFYSPLQNLSDFIPAQVTIGVTKYLKNGITLPQYTSFILAILNQSQQQKQLTIDNSNPIMVTGNPGYRVTFTSSPSSNITAILRTMQIWTIVDNKLYTISYVAEPSKFITYMPKVTQMLDSLRISRSTIATATATGNTDNAVVAKIVNLCKQYQALCGSPICSSIAPSVGVDTASCMNALPAVRGYFNSHSRS